MERLIKTHVLVVDDDASVREATRRILEGAGYEVLLAANGQEALDSFSSSQIDLLILDLDLPVKLGWDVFEELTRRNPCLAIIIITGIANQFHIAAAAGAGALLEKPIEAAVLLETIEEVLAEPGEQRLRRLCGDAPATRYESSSVARFLRRLQQSSQTPYPIDRPAALRVK
jgi:DNA-binding NtrC family response regulator